LILAQGTKVSFERDIGKVIRSIEMNVRPLQRGKMLPDMFWDRNALASQSLLGSLKVARVPDGNGIDHDRER
jgi:hypothetical protein